MEFTAVIFCGKGKALSPFSQIRSTGIPKALLPIANRPMIEYVLEWCNRAFFPRVIVVTSEDDRDVINDVVERYQSNKRQDRKNARQENGEDGDGGQGGEDGDDVGEIEVVGFETDHSGAILAHLYKNELLKENGSDFVILPCDFVTNLPPQVLIEAYRNKDDEDLGILVHYRNQFDIEDKKSKIFPKNYTMYSELDINGGNKCNLLDIYRKEDIDFHKSIQIRTQMCWRYPNTTISTKLLNSTIFFGSTSKIFPIFNANPEKFTDQYFKSRSITKVIRDLARRSWKHSTPKESVGLLIVPYQATFFRSNNLPVLMEANRYFMKQQASSKGHHNQHHQQQDKSAPGAAHVGIDSLVGENTTLGEKTNVKRTVIGKDCVIGKRVKLTGCLILDKVVIEDDVQLENCIIGHDVVVGHKSRLTNCNVESTNEVSSGTQSKGDTLLCLTLEGLIDGEAGARGEDNGDSSAIYDSESDEEDEDDESDDETDSDFEDEYTGNEDGLFAY
ncbi:GCD1 [[Candida] subhashii]|uniref:GCD1 n=1 Tax=[Candida] subhashii TaxID=561895 RepID=A0A8J5UXY7_9ASCO|nr:GCD1 [[Candida] subhashii]KAG7662689.1 GCD1 [[Candida] subhashii]